MKFIKTLFLLSAIMAITLLMSCGEKEKKSDQPNEAMKETAGKIDLNTQEGYEKVIKDLGITIFDGAIFRKVRKSDFYGNNVIEYWVPVADGLLFANAKQAEDSLLSYYNTQLDAILIPKGWMKSQGDQNRLMYIKTGDTVKMFTVSVFTTLNDELDKPKKFLFNYSE